MNSPSPEEFAEDVMALLGSMVLGTADLTSVDPDARRLALALMWLRSAVTTRMAELEGRPLQARVEGVMDAHALVSALIIGGEHPIWMHLAGLRRTRTSITSEEWRRRGVVLAVEIAHKHVSGRKNNRSTVIASLKAVAPDLLQGDDQSRLAKRVSNWRYQLPRPIIGWIETVVELLIERSGGDPARRGHGDPDLLLREGQRIMLTANSSSDFKQMHRRVSS